MANDPMSRGPRFPFSRGNPQAEPGMRDYASRDLPPHTPAPRTQSPSSTDPLSELARLIGQTDPFGEAARNPAPHHEDRAAGWPGSPPPQYSTGLPPLMPEYRDERHPPQDQYVGQHAGPAYATPTYNDPGQQTYDPRYDQQHYAAPPAQYGQGRPDAPYYGDNGQLMQHDPYAADPYGYEERRPRRRSGMIIVGAVLGLAMAGTAGAYAYRTMFNGGMSGPPPLIKADTSPNKVVPAQVSATDTSGKQIYDRVGSSAGQGERLVSREEQPVDVRATATRPSYPANAGQQMPSQFSQQAGTGGSGTLPQTPPAAPQANSQTEPKKVRTVTIRPDQQGSVASAAPAQVPVTPRAAASSARTTAGNAPLSLTPQAATPAQERVAAANTSNASTASEAAPTGVGFMVQVSAQKSQAEASSAFKSAQSKYPNLLGSYQVVMRKKEIAGKGTFYGAQVGPFESREDASGLCAQLKTAGGNCLVEKN